MIALLISLFSIVYCQSHEYDISFMGMNVATVEIVSSDTLISQIPHTYLKFEASTKSAMYNFFYPVNNRYEIIFDNQFHQIKSFQKVTQQPGINNTLGTELINNMPCYIGSEKCIPHDAYTIFTLLHLLPHLDLTLHHKYKIEREGLLYEASLTDYENVILLDLNLIDNSNYVGIIEHTDIFTWAVFKENAVRKIWLDNSKNHIEKCQFKFGIFTLTAQHRIK